ncbi:MAG: PAS domain-containing protein [Anaerolineae bacterium]|nr:PAS domain-containing protein [Anaerolineae bacterium]
MSPIKTIRYYYLLALIIIGMLVVASYVLIEALLRPHSPLHPSEMSQHIHRIEWVVGAVFSVMLVALVLIALFIFHPMEQMIKRKAANLQTEIAKREQAHAELERFFSLALDLLCIADTDGTFLKLNPQWVNTLGYRLDELEGKRFLDLVHPDDLPATLEAIATLGTQTPILNFTNRYRCKDGSYRHIEWRSQPHGKLIYAAARDMTAILQHEADLRQSEERFRAISEITSHYAYQFTILPDGTLCRDWTSSAFTEITGHPVSILDDGVNWLTIIHPDDQPSAIQRYNDLLIGRTTVQEYRLKTPDGKQRWIRDFARPMFDREGKVVGVVGASLDITEQKAAAQQSIDLIIERERSQLLSDFITNTSHELRTPLTIINSGVYLMTRTDDRQKRSEKAAQVTEQVAYLDRMISQLQEMVRLNRIHRLELNSLQPRALIDRFATDYKPKNPLVLLEVEDCPAVGTIEGDTDYLILALTYLVDNAVRYSPDGERVVVYAEQDGDSVRINVRDRGIGIGPEHLDRIFENFYKADPARTQSDSSAGMGLAMVRRIMHLHHGDVEVESKPGRGTVFTLRFPLVEPVSALN